MKRTKKELMAILIKRYIQVVLKDGSVHNGYIGNPQDFKGEDMPETMILINGLLRDVVHVADVDAEGVPCAFESDVCDDVVDVFVGSRLGCD